MAKKSKQIVNISQKNLSFSLDNGIIATLISFNTEKMTLEVNIVEHGQSIMRDDYPFAHLPKNLKKILNPLKES